MASATSFGDTRLAQLTASGSGLAERPVPMFVDEMRIRGWENVDIVFVTGDAYVDHPSFITKPKTIKRILDAMDVPSQKPEPLAHSPPLVRDTTHVTL